MTLVRKFHKIALGKDRSEKFGSLDKKFRKNPSNFDSIFIWKLKSGNIKIWVGAYSQETKKGEKTFGRH